MKVRFWGVRGTIPCASTSHLRYGGNTSCVTVACGDRLLVFDAGSGIRPLGTWVQTQGFSSADLFFSHVHWDHIQGLPFFKPLYQSDFCLSVWAGNLQAQGLTIAQALATQMSTPFFPIALDKFSAELIFRDFEAGAVMDIGDGIHIRTAPLNHPQGATGYRVDYLGESVCYVTDTEHRPGKLDSNIVELIRGASLVIYDSTYTDQEFFRFAGWGHSTWQQGVRLCQAAEAAQLAIFHHDPDHDDVFMDRIAEEAHDLWAGAFVAQEGQQLTL